MIGWTTLHRLVFFYVIAFFSLAQPLVAAGNEPEVWVCNNLSNSVSTIDAITRTVVIPAVSVGTRPLHGAITPDGTQVWVCNTDDDTVSTIDIGTRTIVGSAIPVGQLPGFIAITPDGTQAWVSNFDDDSVVTIDLSTRALVGSPVPVNNAHAIAITPDGTQAWVCDFTDSTVYTIDLSARALVGSPVSVGSHPGGIAITPDGTQAWVCNASSNTVSTIDLGTRTLVGSDVSVGTNPQAIAITPDGTQAWVCNATDGTVSTIDLSTRTIVGSAIPVNGARSIFITPDGTQAWVCNYVDNTVSTIDLSTRTIIGSDVPVGDHPGGIAITPDQAPTARFSTTVNGATVTFDGSASTSPFGGIATYQWNFGDGSSVETTTSPTVSHAYGTAATFPVTLTVTNTSGTSTEQTFTGQTISNNGGPSAELQQQVSPGVFPPRKFKGKADIYRKSRKLFMNTKWKKSTTSDVVRYEIFANNKKILAISSRHHLRKTLRLHPQRFPHSRLSKSYRRYLNSKYRVCAVDAQGNRSQFSPLQVHR
jgi:YVTN family beta-propeller protein